MTTKGLPLLAFTMFTLLAEDAKAPQVTAEMQRDYYRARTRLVIAQQESMAAQKDLEDKIAKMTAVCGDRALIEDATGPVCGKAAQESK